MTATAANDGKLILVDHLVAFIDLLGFRSTIAAPSLEMQRQILQTLEEFKAAEQGFEIRVKAEGDGKRTTMVKPGISTFSDHMVMAFNLMDMQASAVGIYQALMSIRSVANAIAHRGRQFGCLIRGAITIGPLYHDHGIVFGQGLVKAYDLESRIAIYPRIIVDNTALVGVPGGRDSELTMFRDDDGYWCLDYMTAYLDSLNERYGSGPSEEGCRDRRIWALGTRATAREKAQSYEKAGDARAAQNWDWFANRFEKSMRSVNQHHFTMDGSPIDFRD